MRIAAPTIAVFAILTLGGCGLLPSDVPTTAGSPTGDAPTPTDTTTATVAPAVDPTVLFTITATATSPEGAVAHLTQVVYKPVDEVNPDVMSQFNEECTGWGYGFPDAHFVGTTITAEDASPAGIAWDYPPAVVSFDGYPVFTGDFLGFQAPCASIQIPIGGTAHGYLPILVGVSPDEEGGWAGVAYGFGEATDPGWSTKEAAKHVPTITDCSIELSDEAASTSAIAAKWPTAKQQWAPFSCSFGEANYFYYVPDDQG
jgi:hypothetical protein